MSLLYLSSIDKLIIYEANNYKWNKNFLSKYERNYQLWLMEGVGTEFCNGRDVYLLL